MRQGVSADTCKTMLAFALLLVIEVAAQNPGQPFTACDSEQLQRCQGVFNDYLQIDGNIKVLRHSLPRSLNVLTYDKLRAAIEYKIGSEQESGMMKTCDGFKYYKTCYNSRNDYANCANNPLGLIIDQNGNAEKYRNQVKVFNYRTATGISPAAAFGYTKIFNQFDFSCGAGYGEFMNNADCASTVFLNGVSDMRKCDDNLAQSISKDSNPVNTCAYIEVAKECYMTIFSKSCPGRNEVAWWGCNYERVGTQTNYPQCDQIFCTYTDPGRR
ncbi:unnamed protein product [Nippostrongylus brasiliensis]|uniref:SCP domain-containing protein n=1 Tax=Nippostrongylus brasiliensis TaxID=27835 RepID=A0A0N4XTE2_NIPBR|nr:unnamed protein product [Nippostrongylus brasiliensis]